MKKIIITISLIGSTGFINAQIGINTSNPTSSLDIVAKNATGTTTNVDGLIAPRVDRQRAQVMSGIPTGTLIYINDPATGNATGQAVNITSVGYYYFEAGAWQKLTTPASVNALAWNISGNTGTSSATNYLGTADNQDLIFKRNNVQAGLLTTTNTSFGVSSIPPAVTGSGNTALGNNSLSTVTSGVRNVGIGLNTGRGITTGGNNIAIGGNALSSTTAAAIQRNIAIGDNALIVNNGGNSNIAIGVNVGTAVTTGANNTLIGDTAGGITLSTGTSNTVIGSIAGSSLTTGSSNVILGASAGSNITTGGTNIAIGNNSQIPTPTASNQLNIGNAIFGTGMTGTLGAPTGNIGIGTSTPARRLEVNAGAAPIRVSNLQAVNTTTPTTSVPLVLDTATGDIYQGKSSELLISNTNAIPNASPVNLTVTASTTAIGSTSGSLYNTIFTLTRPAIVSMFYSMSTTFATATGTVIADGTPRISFTWARISDSTGATIIQDNMGLSSVSHSNSVSVTSNLSGAYYSSANPHVYLPAGTYKLDIFGSVSCSSSQSVRATYGSGTDNLYLKAEYN